MSLPRRSCRLSDSIAWKPRPNSDGSRRNALFSQLRRPSIAPGHPYIRGMAEQVHLALLFGAEAPGHRLGRRIFAVDAVHDLIELEGRERPVDRCPRRLERVALAAKLAGDAPADFKARPARWKPGSYPPDEFSAGFFLDNKHAGAVQRPMSGHHSRVTPSHQFVGGGLAIGGDESRGAGIGQHRGVGRDVGAAPLPQFEALRLDHGAIRLGKPDAE